MCDHHCHARCELSAHFFQGVIRHHGSAARIRACDSSLYLAQVGVCVCKGAAGMHHPLVLLGVLMLFQLVNVVLACCMHHNHDPISRATGALGLLDLHAQT